MLLVWLFGLICIGIGEQFPVERLTSSLVIDPNSILTVDERELLEGKLNSLKRAMGAVLIVSNLPESMSAEDFTRRQHDHWGIGSEDKNNGVLIMLAVHDRQVYISVGSALTGKIQLSVIISSMKQHLRNGNYCMAALQALDEIDATLGADITPLGGEVVTPPNPVSSEVRSYRRKGLLHFLCITGIFYLLSRQGRHSRDGVGGDDDFNEYDPNTYSGGGYDAPPPKGPFLFDQDARRGGTPFFLGGHSSSRPSFGLRLNLPGSIDSKLLTVKESHPLGQSNALSKREDTRLLSGHILDIRARSARAKAELTASQNLQAMRVSGSMGAIHQPRNGKSAGGMGDSW